MDDAPAPVRFQGDVTPTTEFDGFLIQGHDVFVSASIGIAIPDGGDGVEDLLRHADAAMYQAKDAGRNTIRFFLPGMQAEADERLAMEKDLRKALDQIGRMAGFPEGYVRTKAFRHTFYQEYG